MMGSNDKPQDELFYAFNLEDVVPQDHLLRDIDRVLDLSGLRELRLDGVSIPDDPGPKTTGER